MIVYYRFARIPTNNQGIGSYLYYKITDGRPYIHVSRLFYRGVVKHVPALISLNSTFKNFLRIWCEKRSKKHILAKKVVSCYHSFVPHTYLLYKQINYAKSLTLEELKSFEFLSFSKLLFDGVLR